MYCKKCGKELDNAQSKCSNCGYDKNSEDNVSKKETVIRKSVEVVSEQKGGTYFEALLILGTIIYFIFSMIQFYDVPGAPQQTAICARFLAWIGLCIFCKIIPKH